MRLCVLAGALVAIGCGEKYPRVCADPGVVTYERVLGVFDAYCTECHASSLSGGERNGAPSEVNFDTYQAAKRAARDANSQLLAGTMPDDDPGSVSDEEACLIEAWIEQGFPQ